MTKPDPKPPNPNREITNAETREWREQMLDALTAIKNALDTNEQLASLAERLRAQTSAFYTALDDHSGELSPHSLTRRVPMANELLDLTQAVTELEEVDVSVLQLIDNIAAALDAAIAANDPAALVALKDRLLAQKQALADAVIAHTPAA